MTKPKTSRKQETGKTKKDAKYIKAREGKLINARVTVEMREKIRERAKIYTGGNLSAFVIWAAMNWKPTRAELAAMQAV